MKTLAAGLMTIVLGTFMVVAMASAQEGGESITIHGKYAMSASGSCLHSEMEYFLSPETGRWTVPFGSQVYAGVLVAKGNWDFKEDLTGSYSQTIYATILPGGHVPLPVVPVEVRVLPSPMNFTYNITSSGDITVTQPNGIQLFGSISSDKATMTLLSANNVQHMPEPFWNTICNIERTLIKVGD